MDYFGQDAEKIKITSDKDRYRIMLSVEEIGIVCIGKYINYFPDHALSEHSHEGAVEICYLEKGSQIYSVNNEEYILNGGEVFITLPHELHSTTGYEQSRGSLYWIILEFEKINCLYLNDENAEILLSIIKSMPRRNFDIDKSVADLLKESLQLLINDSNVNKLIASANLIKFIYEIAKQSVKVNENINLEAVEKCEDYIQNNLDKKITIENLAELTNYSVPHFKTMFKKTTGITPHEYILRKKIEIAQFLLKEKSVTDVSYILGFSSSQHFSKVFRQITGVTPSKYRTDYCTDNKI